MNLHKHFFIGLMSAFYFLLAESAICQENKVDPIIIKADHNILHRSFVDLRGGKRVTHAISIGSPTGVHYTYDADNGEIVLLWKGEFLDATPMWHDRGDGSSRPVGKVVQIGRAVPQIQRLSTPQSAFKTDTLGSGFRPKGYTLDSSGLPSFKYQTYGLTIKDVSRVTDGGLGIQRKIESKGKAENLYICLARAKVIELKSDGNYMVDEAYSIVFPIDKPLKPIVRNMQGIQELIIPFQGEIIYAILFNQ